MAKTIHRMFRVHNRAEEVRRGTITWIKDGGIDTIAWVPDGGQRKDISGPIEITEDDKTVSADGQLWDVYKELPVTAKKVSVTVVAVKEPIVVNVGSVSSPIKG